MTWKLYALVSAGAFVATYLVSGPGALTQLTHVRPPNGAPAATKSAPTANVESDIQEQADRLEAHVRGEVAYRAPTRNPFQFAERPRPVTRQVIAPKVTETPPPPVPLPPSITLSGIAEDHVNGVLQRTAIFSSPAGVALAREGDIVGVSYRVMTIEQDVVTLDNVNGGLPLRLSLSRP
jgi:hypothetical protein